MRGFLLFLALVVGWLVPLAAEPLPAPAPVLRFDGEDYFLGERTLLPGARRLTFFRDGDSAELGNRLLMVRRVANRDLREYEKGYLRGWDQAQRDVVYRSKYKLVHSGWVLRGNLLRWRLMHWEQQGPALLCLEFDLISRAPTPERFSMQGLVERNAPNWRKQLAKLAKQAPGLLSQ